MSPRRTASLSSRNTCPTSTGKWTYETIPFSLRNNQNMPNPFSKLGGQRGRFKIKFPQNLSITNPPVGIQGLSARNGAGQPKGTDLSWPEAMKSTDRHKLVRCEEIQQVRRESTVRSERHEHGFFHRRTVCLR